MKHPKRLTRQEKIVLTREGLDHEKWLTVKRLPDDILFVNRETKEQRWVRR